MNWQTFLLIVALWISASATGMAAPPKAVGICTAEASPPVDWLVTANSELSEYKGIVPGETHMKLHTHDHPNAKDDEWEIELVGNKSMSPAPPSADIFRLIKVCGGTELGPDVPPFVVPLVRNSAPAVVNPYLMYAHNVMASGRNYYIGTSNLDKDPTLVIITLSSPTGTSTKLEFNMVLVKLTERVGKPGVRQGGVIHGQQN